MRLNDPIQFASLFVCQAPRSCEELRLRKLGPRIVFTRQVGSEKLRRNDWPVIGHGVAGARKVNDDIAAAYIEVDIC